MEKVSIETGERSYFRELPPEINGRVFAVLPDGTFWIASTTMPRLNRGQVRLDRVSADATAILKTVLLGESGDWIARLSVDRAGNVYGVGSRIWKLSIEGDLVWSTVIQNWYYPGLSLQISQTAVGADGSLYVAGCTLPRVSLETSPGAYQSEPLPDEIFPPAWLGYRCVDGFVSRFSASGERMYSTLLAGRASDRIDSLGVDEHGWATVTGGAGLPGLRTRDLSVVWGSSGFVARIAPDGRAADYVTYLKFPLSNGDASFVEPDGTMFVVGEGPVPIPNDDGWQGETFIARIGPSVPSFPRVDAVTNAPDFGRIYPGATLIIEGESFSPDTRVWLGERELTPDAGITERRLRVAIPLDTPLGPAELRVESTNVSTGERSRSAPVRILIQAPPPSRP